MVVPKQVDLWPLKREFHIFFMCHELLLLGLFLAI